MPNLHSLELSHLSARIIGMKQKKRAERLSNNHFLPSFRTLYPYIIDLSLSAGNVLCVASGAAFSIGMPPSIGGVDS